VQFLTLIVAGFSAVTAPTLFLAYAFLIPDQNKSAYPIVSSAVLLGALTTIQVVHVAWLTGSVAAPFDVPSFRVAMFVVPASFYLFGRWALRPSEPFRPMLLVHLLPPVLLALPLPFALPVLFTIGAGYALWLANVVYRLRAERRRFAFEIFWFGVMAALAVGVLLLGFAMPFVGAEFFHLFYANATGLAFVVITVALIAKPELLADLTEAARAKYGVSTLRGVDVDGRLRELQSLMTVSKLYRDEDLSLGTLAERLGMSTHQLSELVNSRLGMSFSRYVRECRVEAAKALLLQDPSYSVLSIGMETGFRSQSNFYAAFKEVTGLSPGEFRRRHGRS
jgi:AraC-like DNA-binding protein